MQKFVKLLVLISCVFLALVKTAGAQIYVQNAFHRAHTYSGFQKSVVLIEDVSKGGVEQKEPNTKINLSAHVLADILESSPALFLPSSQLALSTDAITNLINVMPASIFRPPRLA